MSIWCFEMHVYTVPEMHTITRGHLCEWQGSCGGRALRFVIKQESSHHSMAITAFYHRGAVSQPYSKGFINGFFYTVCKYSSNLKLIQMRRFIAAFSQALIFFTGI